jgi:hypothetical protein
MRVCLLCVLLIVSGTTVLRAQYWSYTRAAGKNMPVFEMRNDNALVYRAPRENELSAWQPLPFTWMFGDRPVSGYYISDNGYITFDSLARESAFDNAAIDTTRMRNAILGFWDDFILEEGPGVYCNEVRTRTAGTPPARDHVVMWIAVTPHGVRWSASNTVSFAIVLHEAGGFDIVHMAGSTMRPLTGSVGLIGRGAGALLLVPGSPDLPFPPVTADPNDDINYFFSFGPVNAIEGVSSVPDLLDFDLHPNPASGAVTVRVRTSRRERLTVRIFDVLGREAIPECTMGTQPNRIIDISLGALRPGAYIVQLRSGNMTAVRTLQVVR